MSQAGDQELIDLFGTFFREYYHDELAEFVHDFPRERRSFVFSWERLNAFDSDVAEAYLDHPDRYREAAEEALRRTQDIDRDAPPMHARIHDLPESVSLRAVRSDRLHTLISVRGVVRTATGIRPMMVEAAFECLRCGDVSSVSVSGTDVTGPSECQTCGQQDEFTLHYDQSRFVDAQVLRMQEFPEAVADTSAPQTIELRVRDDLAGTASPGDYVTVVGIPRPDDESPETASSGVDVYLDGVSIEHTNEAVFDVEITEADEAVIVERSSQDDVYRHIADMIAPSVEGNHAAKLALTLQLFSGVAKHLPDGSRVRGDIHVLLFGTAANEMLDSIRHVAPRSVYTSGEGTPTTPLTATVVRDEDEDTRAIEGGALVLARNGIAVVRALDRFPSDQRRDLSETLDQQVVTVSKAGFNATLDARCSLLATASLPTGTVDRDEPLDEQIGLDPSVTSQFDLVFPVPESTVEESAPPVGEFVIGRPVGPDDERSRRSSREDRDGGVDETDSTFTPELCRKYVAYAKRNVFPSMTEGAQERLREWYVELRTSRSNARPSRTGPSLEDLVRLAEASARVRLSDTVTEQDIDRVIGLVQSSVSDLRSDANTDPNTAATPVGSDRSAASPRDAAVDDMPPAERAGDDSDPESESESDHPQSRPNGPRSLIRRSIEERPQLVPYTISILLMMTAFYVSSPLYAVLGGGLLVMTGIHYAD